jgi:undecaprenyl diphosphate synthase
VTTQPETAASPLHAQDDVARSVAIIMDGNGRWAESRGLPVAEGHRAGTKALRRTVEAAIDLGIESLTVYAFSTENWTRPPDEVDALMEIFHETIDRELPDLCKQGVRTRFIGRRDRAPDELRSRMADLEAETAANSRLELWIAFDYGGRAEIVDAARRLVEDGVAAEAVDEEASGRGLTRPAPDPI